MKLDQLTASLYAEICKFPIVDPHSHIDPLAPTARSLDDLLGYHYFTELAHSAGMSHEPLAADFDPRERCQTILRMAARFDNTIQYQWLIEIAQTFLGFTNDRITEHDAESLYENALLLMSEPNWTKRVIEQTKLEQIFLTNALDDRLTGFDRNRYVPCLRTDDLVFHNHDPQVRKRLSHATDQEIKGIGTIRQAIDTLFERFTKAGAKACAISLPPNFTPTQAIGNLPDDDVELNRDAIASSVKIFWILAEACRDYRLPFDLMIGVNRNVYPAGVNLGRDLFDQRTSLIQFADLFNAFPDVKFCVSVLTSSQNQELVSYAWIFPNVYPMGHWWYSNIPAYIESDLGARLSAVPKSKLIGYYSDAYKLEFVLPKFNMYRRSLAKVLADEFVKPGKMSESQAVEMAKVVMVENVQNVFLASF